MESDKNVPETLLMGTIENNKDLPKSKRDIPKFLLNTGANIFAKKLTVTVRQLCVQE